MAIIELSEHQSSLYTACDWGFGWGLRDAAMQLAWYRALCVEYTP